MEELATTFILGCCSASLPLLIAWIIFKRRMPGYTQQVLNDVGPDITEYVKAAFTPTVSKAMGLIAARSGEVRHNAALREQFAEKVVDKSPVVKWLLNEFDVTPLEGLELLQDPMVQQLVQGFMKSSGQPLMREQKNNPGCGSVCG